MHIEVARSFSQKLNIGNYETLDFFCSAKAEVDEKDIDAISAKLFQFCQAKVEKDIRDYQNPEIKKVKEFLAKNGQKDVSQWQEHYEQISKQDDAQKRL